MNSVTDLINEINAALLRADSAAFDTSLAELLDVSPSDAQDVLRILGPLAGMVMT